MTRAPQLDEEIPASGSRDEETTALIVKLSWRIGVLEGALMRIVELDSHEYGGTHYGLIGALAQNALNLSRKEAPPPKP